MKGPCPQPNFCISSVLPFGLGSLSRRARNCAHLRLAAEGKEPARQSRLLNPLADTGAPALLPERRSASSSNDEGISAYPADVLPDVPFLGKKGGKDTKGKDN